MPHVFTWYNIKGIYWFEKYCHISFTLKAQSVCLKLHKRVSCQNQRSWKQKENFYKFLSQSTAVLSNHKQKYSNYPWEEGLDGDIPFREPCRKGHRKIVISNGDWTHQEKQMPSRHNRPDVYMNPQRLWQHAQSLKSSKPHGGLCTERGSRPSPLP